VRSNSPADDVGLSGLSRTRDGRVLQGDIIKAINDQRITDNESFRSILEKYKPEDEIKVTFTRGDKVYDVDLRLASVIE